MCILRDRGFAVLALVVAAGGVCCPAAGDVFDGVVDQAGSSALLLGDASIHNTGILIGDFDAKTIPDGTRTIPGLFGGSGNNPIGVDLTGVVGVDLDTSPSGSVSMDVDFDALTIDLAGLSVDLLGGQSGGAQPSVSMLYSTFHTVNPSFIYPGGVPIDVPVGEGSSIDEALILQTGDGLGVLTPTADPDIFDFTMAVPAELSMVFTLGFDGVDPSAGDVAPTPVVLPLVGTVERLVGGGVVLTVDIETQVIDEDTPITGVTTPEIPFELPTFGAETAGVLFTLTPDLLSVGASYSWSLVIDGAAAGCVGDFNGDGELDFLDISIFLDAFTGGDLLADMNGDGELDFLDISAFLDSFTGGCP